MNDTVYSTRDTVRGVRTSTRRDALAAAGFTALAGIAGAGFCRPDQPRGLDWELLAACAAFDQADAAMSRFNAGAGWDEDESSRALDNWNSGIEGILAAPRPVTRAGRVAMAGAARRAFLFVSTEQLDRSFEQQASREQKLALATINLTAGA